MIMDEGFNEFFENEFFENEILEDDFIPELLPPEIMKFILTELQGILNKLNIKSTECPSEEFTDLVPISKGFSRVSSSNIAFPIQSGTNVATTQTSSSVKNIDVTEASEIILVPCGELLQ